jgi:hypothetical protein
MADVRYFGDFAVCLRIDAALQANFSLGYGVDPLEGTQRDHDDWEGLIGVPGLADTDALIRCYRRALSQVLEVARPRRQAALARFLLEDSIVKVLGEMREPKDDAEYNAVLARVDAEFQFLMSGSSRVDDDPELADTLQAFAEDVRAQFAVG